MSDGKATTMDGSLFSPNDTFDHCVVGTSLESSILATKLAKEGKKILHIDEYPWYGGIFDGTISLCQVQSLVDSGKLDGFYHVASHCSEYFASQGRKFKVDLMPRLLLAGSEFCSYLVQEGTSSYLEFTVLSQIYVHIEDSFLMVPGSKEHIFTCQALSLLEKRQIWKLVTACQFNAHNEMALHQLPDLNMLSSRLSRLLLYGICWYGSEEEANTASQGEIIKKVAGYKHGLGIYGSYASPYLYPTHGSSELVQAFCRQSALHGGVQLLGQKDLNIEQGFGTEIDTDTLISGTYEYVDWKVHIASTVYKQADKNMKNYHRSVHILEGSLSDSLENCKETILFVIPPKTKAPDQLATIFILQCAPATCCVPTPYYLVHGWSDATTEMNASVFNESMEELISSGFQTPPPSVLYKLYFTIKSSPFDQNKMH